VGTLRLGSFLFMVVLYGVFVAVRPRSYLKDAVSFSCGGLSWLVHSRALAWVP
jgi:hypothetical protein